MRQFSEACHRRLYDYCQGGQSAKQLLDPFVILGGVFAVAGSPDIPLPQVWLPWIFQPEVDLSEVSDIDGISETAMQCMQWQLRQMRNNQVSLLSQLTMPKLDDKQAPLSLWMQGLLLNHARLEPIWQAAWQVMEAQQAAPLPALQKNLRHCLTMFSTFADIPFALQQAERKGNRQLGGSLAKIYLSLPEALRLYVSTAGSLVDYLPDQFESYMQQLSTS